jgi:hypothetical protein
VSTTKGSVIAGIDENGHQVAINEEVKTRG